MDFLKAIKSKKYLSRIYLLITATLLVSVIIFSIVVYFNVERLVMDNDLEANNKVLMQIKYNIEKVDEYIRTLGLSAYMNNDFKKIMFSNNVSMYDLLTIKDNIYSSFVLPNSFIHSMHIYNGRNKVIYSTEDRQLYSDTSMSELLKRYDSIYKTKTFRRTLWIPQEPDSGKYINIYSYFIYPKTIIEDEIDGALIINVNMDWYISNIKMLNMANDKNQDIVLLFDQEGNWILNKEGESKKEWPLYRMLQAKFKELDILKEKTGFRKYSMNGENYLLTYIMLDHPDWSLVKIQSYDEVFKYIGDLKASIIIITLIFLLIAGFISFSISKGIYSPFGKLVEGVKLANPGRINYVEIRDEITYLDEIIKSTSGQLNLYKEKNASNSDIIRAYYLKKLLVDSQNIEEGEWANTDHDLGILLDLNKPMVVCVVKIDYNKEFITKFNSKDQELCKYALKNILKEVISEKYQTEIVDNVRVDELNIILNIDSVTADFTHNITEVMRKTQKAIIEGLKISVSISISDVAMTYQELTNQYNKAQSGIMYRYVFGRLSVIEPKKALGNNENISFENFANFEKKLSEEIRGRNFQNSVDALLRIFYELARLNYYSIKSYEVQLINIINEAVSDMNKASIRPVYADFHDIYQKIFEMETIDDTFSLFCSMLQSILVQSGPKEEKQSIIVEAIKSIVDANYFKSDLQISTISSMLKLSSFTIGKVFKENTGMTITEYITEIRMKKAVEWLQNTNLSVTEIMSKIGMDNESNFYRVFKRKFGTTPKEFILKKALDRKEKGT